MPEEKKLLALKDLEPLMREAFAAGQAFWLPVTGTSNLPTLTGGRDTVILAQVQGALKRGDLPLYRRDSGQYVLHRIVSVQKDGTYTCCGDHQWVREPHIRQDQLIAKVVWITRKGREFSAQNNIYRAWVRIWVFLLPCRSFLIRSCSAITRIYKRLFSKR